MTLLAIDQSVCPDENALAELVQGLLDPEMASQIESHLDHCAECRRIVSSVGQSSYIANRMTRIDPAAAANSTWLMFGQTSTLQTVPAPDSAVRARGDILVGKYQIERILGQGGMGVVMAAKHLTLGKLVAIKLMRPELLVDANAAQRFVREARAASRLRSEHIVRVIDLDTLDDGAPYIAMEYLEGEDLGALLARGGPIAAKEAATYIVQVCEAVSEAHAAGIVHRDLKPANLFVTRRGDGSPCMKVLDFGVSKIIAGGPLADDLTSTDTKALVGSPHYMAPEQLISARAVDPRTDVWALGCILFELVCGRTPFAATALAQVLASILRDDAPPLNALCPHIPPGFAAIVARCLEKDPSRRFQRVDELALALAPFVSEPVAIATPAVPSRGAAVRPGSAPAKPRPTRVPIVIAVTLLLGIAGIAAHQVVDQSDAPKPADTPVHLTPPVSTPRAAAPIDAGVAPVAADPVVPAVEVPATKRRLKSKKRLEDDLLEPRL